VKVTYKALGGRLSFEADAENVKAAFELVASIQELFEEPSCGLCDSQRIRCDVRNFDAYCYFKLVCTDCNAQLDFGQHKDGRGLFVKRRDKDGRLLENRGWYIWAGKSD
jgi:hypothetical protein